MIIKKWKMESLDAFDPFSTFQNAIPSSENVMIKGTTYDFRKLKIGAQQNKHSVSSSWRHLLPVMWGSQGCSNCPQWECSIYAQLPVMANKKIIFANSFHALATFF